MKDFKDLTKGIKDFAKDIPVVESEIKALPEGIRVRTYRSISLITGAVFKVDKVVLETTELNGTKYGYFMAYNKEGQSLSVKRLMGASSALWGIFFQEVPETAIDWGDDILKVVAYLRKAKPTLKVVYISPKLDQNNNYPILFEVV